jgi:hypothetical protein
MMASSIAIFILFWGILGMIAVNWLLHGASFSVAYFNQEMLQLMATEFQKKEDGSIVLGHCAY